MCRDGTNLIDLTHLTDRRLISPTDRVSNSWISRILGLLLTNGLQNYRSLCFWSKGRTFNNADAAVELLSRERTMQLIFGC